jgi:hypothetical protein
MAADWGNGAVFVVSLLAVWGFLFARGHLAITELFADFTEETGADYGNRQLLVVRWCWIFIFRLVSLSRRPLTIPVRA